MCDRAPSDADTVAFAALCVALLLSATVRELLQHDKDLRTEHEHYESGQHHPGAAAKPRFALLAGFLGAAPALGRGGRRHPLPQITALAIGCILLRL